MLSFVGYYDSTMIGIAKFNLVLVGDGLDNRYTASDDGGCLADGQANNELAPEEDSPLQSKISSMCFGFALLLF